MTDVFLGRQPIQDRKVRPIGYEILHRVFGEPDAAITDPDQATARVILNTFIEIDLDVVVGPTRRAFFNLSPRFLIDRCHRSLPRDRVVLEVPAECAADPAVVEAVLEAGELGYLFAIDRFLPDAPPSPLLPAATFVKIDVSGLNDEGMRSAIDRTAPLPAKTIAQKVSSRELFELSHAAGFDFFQGFFFCEPALVTQRTAPVDRSSLLTLVAELQDPEIDLDRVTDIVTRDVSLSYRLLRLVNSAMYSFRSRIESIAHAITLLGLGRVRALISLILLASVDDKPRELMRTALVRARFCELVARAREEPRPDVWFSVGLLSVLDALTDRPMRDVLSSLRLSDEITSALLGGAGEPGNALSAALACESGAIEHESVRRLGQVLTQESYYAAFGWANGVDQAVGASA
ncbi:MAG: EAL and HDOD domain-containing protein [Planctomycetota bacterium JB042]